MEQNRNRVVYFDYLRVFAILAVIVLHAAAQNWLKVDVSSTEWKFFNIFDSLSRWGVPCFVMISGALFLPRTIALKKIFSKYILRMVIAYFVWSFFYAAYGPALKLLFVDGYTLPLRTIIGSTLRGHYHLWFMPMIVGLYMCIPFMQSIAQNRNNIRYFLILAFIFASVLPQFSILTGHFGGSFLTGLADCINRIIRNMRFHMVLGYAGYFMLGFYLNRLDMKTVHRRIIYLLGAIGAVATIVLTAAASRKTGTHAEGYYDNFSVNVLLMSVAIFTLCKSVLKNGIPGCGKLISTLSKCSFGAYLVHIFVMDMLNRFGINSLSFHPALSVPFLSAIVAIASFAISYILNRIPFLNRYIV